MQLRGIPVPVGQRVDLPCCTAPQCDGSCRTARPALFPDSGLRRRDHGKVSLSAWRAHPAFASQGNPPIS
ncbi:hypothetical protein XELAEV_18004301mg [Xenopus laevis]|uniref:Uncharacterized protein n=1 Tax=Xenopus laevis TaxID=8355 RepID=A0A974GY34_XENLA|nr:hypothetical protein XELAEV_18004301mg [Xenopus laevis]